MGSIFFWMGKPDPGIPDSSWIGFLDQIAVLTVLIVLITVLATILCYTSSARRRKIYAVDDLFALYSPICWILLAIPGALIGAALCLWQYQSALGTVNGRWGLALQIALLNGIASALISYCVIIFVRPLTPAKFRYRPAIFHHKRSARLSEGRN